MPLVDFKFTRAWIHAGVAYVAGDTAALKEGAASRLREQGAGDFAIADLPAEMPPETPRKRGMFASRD